MAAARKPVAVLRKILPLFNRILIRKMELPKESEGGIVFPEDMKHKPLRGTVVAVGPGDTTPDGKYKPVCLKQGDEVILPDYGGNKIDMNGEQLFIYRECDIIAKLD